MADFLGGRTNERMRIAMLLRLLSEMIGPQPEDEPEELPEHWQPAVREPSIRVRPDFFPRP